MTEIRDKCAVCDNILHNIFSLENAPIKSICVEDSSNSYFTPLRIENAHGTVTFALETPTLVGVSRAKV
jgi:hypothetical protein